MAQTTLGIMPKQVRLFSTHQNPIIFNLDTATTFNLVIELEGCSTNNSIATKVSIETEPIITNITNSTAVCEGQNVGTNCRKCYSDYGSTKPIIGQGQMAFKFTGQTSNNLFTVTIPNITKVQRRNV